MQIAFHMSTYLYRYLSSISFKTTIMSLKSSFYSNLETRLSQSCFSLDLAEQQQIANFWLNSIADYEYGFCSKHTNIHNCIVKIYEKLNNQKKPKKFVYFKSIVTNLSLLQSIFGQKIFLFLDLCRE